MHVSPEFNLRLKASCCHSVRLQTTYFTTAQVLKWTRMLSWWKMVAAGQMLTQTFPAWRTDVLFTGLLWNCESFSGLICSLFPVSCTELKSSILLHRGNIPPLTKDSQGKGCSLTLNSWAHIKSHIKWCSHVGCVQRAAIILHTDSTNPCGEHVSMYAVILAMHDSYCWVQHFLLLWKSAALWRTEVVVFLPSPLFVVCKHRFIIFMWSSSCFALCLLWLFLLTVTWKSF